MSLPYEFNAKTVIEEGRTTREAIDQIHDWLSTANIPELPEEMIVLFLLSCKNLIKTTQNTIKAYFKIKNEAPEIFNGRDVDSEEMKKVYQTVVCCSIPTRMKNNTVVHFFRLIDTNYRNFDLINSMKAAFMIVDISQRVNPPNELVVVLDMKGVGIMHLTCFRLGPVKKFLEFLQEAMPLRIQKIHILNSSYVFDKILAIARAFIKNEMMSLIKTHPPGIDMEEFYKEHVPASCLPEEYGGELPTSEELNQRAIEQLRELRPLFEAEEKLRTFYQ